MLHAYSHAVHKTFDGDLFNLIIARFIPNFTVIPLYLAILHLFLVGWFNAAAEKRLLLLMSGDQ